MAGELDRAELEALWRSGATDALAGGTYGNAGSAGRAQRRSAPKPVGVHGGGDFMDGPTPMKAWTIGCVVALYAFAVCGCSQGQQPIPPPQLATEVTPEVDGVTTPPAPRDPLSLESPQVRAAI